MNKIVTLFFGILIFMLSSFSTFGQVPVITKEPSPIGVIAGQGAQFSVEASGDSLTYQWFLYDSLLAGADESVYVIPSAPISMNAFEYRVVVSNSDGADTSKTVNLWVTAAGSRVFVTEIARYIFKEKSGDIIHDQANLTTPLDLTINNTSEVDWSNYGLYVDAGAQIRSSDLLASGRVTEAIKKNDELTIEMWVRPLTTGSGRIVDFSTSKTNINFGVENFSGVGYNFLVRTTTTNNLGIPGLVDDVTLGTNLIHLTFTHSAEGLSKVYRNGLEVASDTISGSFSNWVNGASLSLGSYFDNSIPWEGIYYLVVIFERALDSAEVVHNYSLGLPGLNAPFIIEQPLDNKLLAGSNAAFSITAVGNALTYQWQENGVDIPGATNDSLSIPNVSLSDSGKTYRVIVSNTSGKDTSDVALLEVTVPNPDCPEDITHYYKLDESSSPYNDAISFSDGISSTPPAVVPGVLVNAQNFSDDEIDIADDPSFDWNADASFTMQLWMKTSTTPASTQVLLGRDAPSGGLQWWLGLSANGRAAFSLHNTTGEGVTVGDKSPEINDGEWHLVSGVRDESVNKNYLYVDGVKIDSALINYSADFASDAKVTLGYFDLAPFYYYSGSIDEVSFLNRALSGADIMEHYTNVLAGFGYCQIPPTIAAPGNLIALLHPADTSKVDLTWEDNSPDELGFIIQRAEGDSDVASVFIVVDTVNADITSYTDFSTDTSTTYTYRIYAYNADTVSAFSNLAEITTKVPVELTSFTVSVLNGKATIYWETATETNNSGFAIERSSEKSKFEQIAFIKGKGSTAQKSAYSYIDKSVQFGKYSYRLKQIDLDGSYNYSNTVEADLGLPKNFALDQNYPNPFNPSTTIKFTLPANSRVSIKLYNTLGQEVTEILKGEFEAGVHETVFNAAELSSGIYFYRLEAAGADGSNHVAMKRMALIK